MINYYYRRRRIGFHGKWDELRYIREHKTNCPFTCCVIVAVACRRFMKNFESARMAKIQRAKQERKHTNEHIVEFSYVDYGSGSGVCRESGRGEWEKGERERGRAGGVNGCNTIAK